MLQMSPPPTSPPVSTPRPTGDSDDRIEQMLEVFGQFSAGDFCHILVENKSDRNACAKALSRATFGFYSQKTIYNHWGFEFTNAPQKAIALIQAYLLLTFIVKLLERNNVPISGAVTSEAGKVLKRLRASYWR